MLPVPFYGQRVCGSFIGQKALGDRDDSMENFPTAPLNLAGFGSGSGSTFMLTELDDVTTFLSTGCLVVKNPIETFSYWTTVISYFPEVIDSLPDFCGYIMTFFNSAE